MLEEVSGRTTSDSQRRLRDERSLGTCSLWGGCGVAVAVRKRFVAMED